MRRRGRGSTPAESTTTEVTNETTDAATSASTDTSPAIPSTKTVPELLAEESQSNANFLALAAAVVAFFLFMLQTTSLPPPGRVYSVMIDAGSTGTRAQVFAFRHLPGQKGLILDDSEVFKMKKSIAALGTGTVGSGGVFFKPLMEKLRKKIPGVRRRQRTPIALHATAGLRLIGEEQAETALEEARKALNISGFLFQEDWVSILEEQEEASHAWTTVNFLKGHFHGHKGITKRLGALDLGGASMQMVFERENGDEAVDTGEEDDDNLEGRNEAPENEDLAGDDAVSIEEADYTVSVFGDDYPLHSTSHLGLGLFDFTKKLYTLFDREGVLEEGNPCFRKGKVFANKELRFGVPGTEESRTVTMTGDGDFERCVASAEITIATFSKLRSKKSVLPKGKPFYAFAYFYDRTVRLGLPITPTKAQLIAKGRELCETPPDVRVERDFDQACAEFSYVYTLLKIFTDDFASKDVQIRFEQYIDGHMLGWALGAALDIVQPVMHKQLALEHEPLIAA